MRERVVRPDVFKTSSVRTMSGIENENCTITFQAGGNYVRMQWRGEASSPNYRAAWTSALQVAVESKATGLLLDLRELEGASMIDRAWLMAIFVPQVVSHFSLQCRAAILRAAATADQATSRNVVELVRKHTNYPIRYFDREEEAVAWLTENQATPDDHREETTTRPTLLV